MTRQNIEDDLVTLAHDWPLASVRDAVMARIESPTVRPARSRKLLLTQGTFGAAAAVALLILVSAIALFLTTPSTLQAQIESAIAKAKSAHVTVSGLDSAGVRHKAEIWYSADRGFRAESDEEIILDDGQQQFSWRPGTPEKELVVSRRQSRNAMDMIGEMFQLQNAPAEWKQQRSEAHDREINRHKCEAYIVQPPSSDVRAIVLVDDQKRIVQVEDQRQIEGQWNLRREISIDYDAAIPAEKFVADFPSTARVIDPDRALEEQFPLDRALATVESNGLLFAIHEAAHVEDDMIYVLSSVRGTAEYLAKNPPKKRRLNLQTTVLDVAEQPATTGVAGDFHRATLAHAESNGIQYVWWLAIRRTYFQVQNRQQIPIGKSESFEVEPGRIRIPLQAIFRSPRSNWINAEAHVNLDPQTPRRTVLELCGDVRRNVLLIGQGAGVIAMHGGIHEDRLEFLEPHKTDDGQYARGIKSQIDWLRGMDEVQQ